MRRPQSPRNPSRPRQTEARRGQPRPSGQLEPGEFADAKTPEERTQAIFELMVDGRFTWGTSTELAALWNVAPVTARNYAAEAVRLYRRLVAGFGEDLRARIMARLEFIGRDSLERTEEVVDGMGDKHTVRRPDHRTARQCVMDQAQLAGLLVHKHTMSVTEMTDEELRAQLRAHGLEVVQVAAPSNREETH